MIPLNKIFEIQYGHSLELNRLSLCAPKDGGVPFISRKMGDNGIAAYVEPIVSIKPAPAGELTCALSGNGVLSTFLQETTFYTGFHVARLRPNISMSKAQLLFYCACIAANRYRFSFGRQANKTLRNLMLPEMDEIPNWVQSTDVEPFNGADAPVFNLPTPVLDTSNWKYFEYQELFKIERGESFYLKDLNEGQFPYVSASAQNNGVTSYVSIKNQDGSAISLAYDGSIGEAFYQPKPFLASEKIAVLRINKKWSKELNPSIALFLITLIRKEKIRYNYGLKWSINSRLLTSLIKLPVTPHGKPDWPFMENYIKTLPYSSQI